MNFSDDSSQAANYLRKAIPAMVKHNIVPNPLNYTLWYSYFADTFPQLNKELEETIERYGTCPAKVGESLFIQHISKLDNSDEDKIESFQKAISSLVNNLSDSIDSTAKQANDYSAALKDNISALESKSIDDSLRPILSDLNANATAIYDANQLFHGQLSTAQLEINSLKEELEKSRREANTDPLTGLCNRRVLEAIYIQFIEQQSISTTKNDQLSLIIMDIDKFKLFNDTHGHPVGDQVLKFVAKLLQNECPDTITPVRYGGEEFAMLCPNCTLDEAKSIAENIRIKLSTMVFKNNKTGQRLPHITASFGLATKNPEEHLSQLIERADKALYLAKDEGRNQVQVAK